MRTSLIETVLPLRHTFTIARGSQTHSHTIVLELEHEGVIGLGEASPVERYHESVASVKTWFSEHPPAAEDPFCFEELLAGIPMAARCALDVSIHDWIGKKLGLPLWHYLDLDPAKTPLTSFTIGIDATEHMLAKLDEVRDHPIMKIKLGADRAIEIIEAVRSRFSGILRIDANEAWTPEQSVQILNELERFDIELCEQPIPAGRPEQLRWIRERVSIPLVADEDAKHSRDVYGLRDCVDGINIKLVKSGGIRGALDMIRTARSLGMKVMIGCMVESSILATAAAQLTPLVDWADIDGPLLISDDPYIGITYREGKIILPAGPGLGVAAREQCGATTC